METDKRLYHDEAFTVRVTMGEGHTGVVARLYVDDVKQGADLAMTDEGGGVWALTARAPEPGNMVVYVLSNEGARWESPVVYVRPFPG